MNGHRLQLGGREGPADEKKLTSRDSNQGLVYLRHGSNHFYSIPKEPDFFDEEIHTQCFFRYDLESHSFPRIFPLPLDSSNYLYYINIIKRFTHIVYSLSFHQVRGHDGDRAPNAVSESFLFHFFFTCVLQDVTPLFSLIGPKYNIMFNKLQIQQARINLSSCTPSPSLAVGLVRPSNFGQLARMALRTRSARRAPLPWISRRRWRRRML
jgi:hypothetical protein